MARRASGSLRLSLKATQSSTGVGAAGQPASLNHDVLFERTMVSGTAAGEIDRVYPLPAQALTTTPTDIDLSGTLADALDTGVTVVFVDVQAIYIENTGANIITVGGDANDVGPTGSIPVGGCFFYDFGTDGRAITGASNDVLQLAAASSTTTARVLIIGRSA